MSGGGWRDESEQEQEYKKGKLNFSLFEIFKLVRFSGRQ